VTFFDDDVRPVRCQAALSESNCQRTLLGDRFIPPIRITPRHPTSSQAPENDDTSDSAGQQHFVRRKIQVCPDDADIKGEGRDRMPNTLS